MRLLITLLISSFTIAEAYFPGNTWETRTAQESNLNEEQIDKLFDLTFSDPSNNGCCFNKRRVHCKRTVC